MSTGVRLHGADDLNRALASVGSGLDGAVRRADTAAAELVARDASSKARSLGSTAAHSAPAIYTDQGGDAAVVGLNGDAYPMAPGAEFGSTQFAQFKPWRGGDDGGYFLYPTVRADEDQIDDLYAESLDDLIERTPLA